MKTTTVKGIIHLLLAFMTLAFTTFSHAVLIDFEGIPTQNFGPSTVIDGVKFSQISSTGDPQVRIFNNSTVRTAYILACDFSLSGCVENLEVDFGQAVSNLSFDFLADEQTSGAAGSVQAFLNNSLVSSISLFGDGDGNTHEFVNLTSLGNIDRLVFNPSDPAGLGYDNFSFQIGGSTVPEPSVLWLLGTGLIGLIGFAKRKKA